MQNATFLGQYNALKIPSGKSSFRLGQILALLASLMVITQIGFILFQHEAYCPGEGCAIVENLTRIAPLYFNLAGLAFFQVIFWSLFWVARQHISQLQSSREMALVRILLLAALGVEGVLVGFQHQVVERFCIYCLCVLGFVVLLNLSLGLRQAVKGLLLFAAVFLAFSSLNFQQASSGNAFKEGVFAVRAGEDGQSAERYLFFSSTCAHCQEVLVALRAYQSLGISFNPLDTITELDLAQVQTRPDYTPEANKALLRSLGIDDIPVLLVKTPQQTTVLRGERAILSQLASLAHPSASNQEQSPSSGQADMSTEIPADIGIPLPELQPEQTDSCQVDAECESGSPP